MAGETFTTYDAVGMAEDVSDIITNIDPFDTPFQTLIGAEKTHARMPEWQEDSLAAVADMADPLIEGAEYSDTARGATAMRSNYTEIRGLAFSVSETSDAVRTYGRAKETAFQLAKAGKELKRAWEVRLLTYADAASDVVTGVDAAVGSESAAREAGNVFGEDPGSVDILTNRSAATTTQVIFTEDAYLAGAKINYDNGADAKVLMVSAGTALIVKDWATLPSGRFRDNEMSKKLVMVVDYLVTPFGETKVVLNRWLGEGRSADQANAALLCDPGYWKICTLRPWAKLKLAKTADSERYALRGEFTLKHRNYDEGYAWVNLDAPVAA